VLPHELVHLAVVRPWTGAVRIDLDPTTDPRFAGRRGIDRPLARFDAAVPPSTPRWAIRLAAVAPLPVFLTLAVALDAVVGLAGRSPTTVLATAAFTLWASLSDGDLAVFLAPDQVRQAGAFVVRSAPRGLAALSTVLTVVLTVIMATVFVR
jgi:hypothetical protein